MKPQQSTAVQPLQCYFFKIWQWWCCLCLCRSSPEVALVCSCSGTYGMPLDSERNELDLYL